MGEGGKVGGVSTFHISPAYESVESFSMHCIETSWSVSGSGSGSLCLTRVPGLGPSLPACLPGYCQSPNYACVSKDMLMSLAYS